MFLAEALNEVDELQEAEQILALYLPIVREFAMPDLLIAADSADSLSALKTELRNAQSQQRNRRLQAQDHAGRPAQGQRARPPALRTMQEVLEAGCAQNLVRAFVDEGRPVVDLVREVRLALSASLGGSPPAERERMLLVFIDRILHRAGVHTQDAAPRASQSKTASEAAATAAHSDSGISLSERELRVLESVAQGLPNAATAEAMFVAETTVRAHLRKINVKLGASNRTQAVASTRRLGLLRT